MYNVEGLAKNHICVAHQQLLKVSRSYLVIHAYYTKNDEELPDSERYNGIAITAWGKATAKHKAKCVALPGVTLWSQGKTVDNLLVRKTSTGYRPVGDWVKEKMSFQEYTRKAEEQDHDVTHDPDAARFLYRTLNFGCSIPSLMDNVIFRDWASKCLGTELRAFEGSTTPVQTALEQIVVEDGFYENDARWGSW